jgi:hypothetical protein
VTDGPIFLLTVDLAKRFTSLSEHCEYWKHELFGRKLFWGMFSNPRVVWFRSHPFLPTGDAKVSLEKHTTFKYR